MAGTGAGPFNLWHSEALSRREKDFIRKLKVASLEVATDHVNLANLQGGTSGEYYHLTSAQRVVVTNTSNTNTGDETLASINTLLSLGTQDAGFLNFQATIDADATSAISSFTTSGATTHHVQIDLNGTTAWIAVSTTDPTA